MLNDLTRSVGQMSNKVNLNKITYIINGQGNINEHINVQINYVVSTSC